MSDAEPTNETILRLQVIDRLDAIVLALRVMIVLLIVANLGVGTLLLLRVL